MSMVQQRDLNSLVLEAPASAFTTITAGGAGDNVPVVGLPIDRFSFGVALTAFFGVQVEAALAASATLTVKNLLVEHSADGVTWSTYTLGGTLADPGVVLSAPAGSAGTYRGVARVPVALREARRFVRFTFTPDLSSPNTDTANAVVHAVFSGFDLYPAIPGSPL